MLKTTAKKKSTQQLTDKGVESLEIFLDDWSDFTDLLRDPWQENEWNNVRQYKQE